MSCELINSIKRVMRDIFPRLETIPQGCWSSGTTVCVTIHSGQ